MLLKINCHGVVLSVEGVAAVDVGTAGWVDPVLLDVQEFDSNIFQNFFEEAQAYSGFGLVEKFSRDIEKVRFTQNGFNDMHNKLTFLIIQVFSILKLRKMRNVFRTQRKPFSTRLQTIEEFLHCLQNVVPVDWWAAFASFVAVADSLS